MDRPSDALMLPSLTRLGLSDEEFLVAASYLQGVESLAVIRCKAIAYTAAMLFSHYAAIALLGVIGPEFANVCDLLDVLRNCGLVASLLMLLLSIVTGLFLIRELRDAALPDAAKHYLRRRSASMEIHLCGRFVRRGVAWLRAR